MRRLPPLLLLTLFALVLACPAPARAACATTPASTCTTSPGAPAAGAGSREYVCTGDTINKFQYYDGFTWQTFSLKSSAGTECVSPMGPGAWNYGQTADFDWEYCDNASTPACHQLDCARYCSSPLWGGTLTTSGPLVVTDGGYGQAANNNFGYAVAVNDKVAAFGVPNMVWYAGVAGAGLVYLYDISDPGAGAVWTGFKGGAITTNEHYGWSLAISGNMMVVGAPGNSSAAGAVYVYTLVNPAGAWNAYLLATITDPLATANDQFGYSVALDGNTLVVGASGSAKVYAFDLTNISTNPSPSTPNSTISQPAGATNFGFSVAVSGTRMIAGAYGATANAGAIAAAGRAYVYDLTSFPSNPTGVEITAGSASDAGADAAANDGFGYAVAISGTTAVVSSYHKQVTFTVAGKFYVYDVTTPATPVYKSAMGNPDGISAGESFGKSMAMSGVKLAVGVPGYPAGGNTGAIFVYDLSTITAPALQVSGVQGAFAAANDTLGASVAISNDKIAAGAPNKNENFQANAGAGYVVNANCGGTSCKTYGTCTTEGQLEYNNSWDLQYCNHSLNWAPFGPCLGAKLTFPPLINQYPSYNTTGTHDITVTSSILQIPASVNCNQLVSIADDGITSPATTGQFRLCSDSACATPITGTGHTGAGWGTAGFTASPGNYVQMSMKTAASITAGSNTRTATLSLNGTPQTPWTAQTRGPMTVFVTDNTNGTGTFRGGGVSGFTNGASTWNIATADAICQGLADANGIGTIATGHKFYAWIAGSTADDPNTRFQSPTGSGFHWNYAYAGTTGLTIASSWTTLTNGTALQNSGLLYDETGTSVSAGQFVWTNVGTNGIATVNGAGSDGNCSPNNIVNTQWTSGGSGQHGYVGLTGSTTGAWTTNGGTWKQCNTYNNLYCFEQ